MFAFVMLIAGCIGVGFAFGVTTKAFLDKDEIHEMEKDINRLSKENKSLRSKVKTEVIEIRDSRVKDVQFGGF